MVKYRVKKGYEDAEVVASTPISGRKSGARYILKECSQRELKYLYDVVKFGGIEIIDEKKNQAGICSAK